jgi:hypothetical protein
MKRWSGYTHGRKKISCKTLIKKSERKINVGSSRFKQRDNIQIDIKRTGCEVMEQAPLYHGRVKWGSLLNTKFNMREIPSQDKQIFSCQ